MGDVDLRNAERRALASEDDPAAGHEWLAAADRAGDLVQATRALGHLVRLGDARGYDEHRARVPWPHARGAGGTRFLPVASLDDPVGVAVRQPGFVLAASDDVVIWRDGHAGPVFSTANGVTHPWGAASSVWLTPAAAAALRGDVLSVRDPSTRSLIHDVGLPTGEPTRVSLEADRALVVAGGAALLIDLLGDPGHAVWDTRALARPAAVSRTYDPKQVYRPGDVVSHPKFGDGAVVRADARKVTIAFAQRERALVHAGATSEAPADAPVIIRSDSIRQVLLAGSLALLEDERRVTALDARTGRLLWATEGPAKIGAADVRGVVLHQSADPRRRATTWSLVELEPRSGRERWFFPSSGIGYVALGEDVALAVRTKTKGWIDREAERELIAIERESGTLRWRRPERSVCAVTRAHVLSWDPPHADLFTGADVG